MKNEPKLTLNIRSPALQKRGSNNGESLRKAAEVRKLHNETYDEAWARILAMKNSPRDDERLREVKRAMDEGKIGRDSPGKRFSKAEALRLAKVLDEIEAKERIDEMVANTPSNYRLVTTRKDFVEFLRILDRENEIVFDVETTGTDVWSDYIVGHVISAIKAGIHAYIPTRHDVADEQLDNDYVNTMLRPFYESESLGKIAHNAGFDIHMLDREGIKLRGLAWDTLEAMKLLNENEPTYALKPLVTKYLRDNSHTYGELFGKRGFNEIPLDQALAYAAKDGDVTLKLRDFQRHHLSKMPSVKKYFETVEIPLISVIVDMEKEGYIIDQDFAKRYGDELRRESEVIGKRIFAEFGEINLNSPVQLKTAIERHIGKEIENTDAKRTLKPLANEYEVIADLLKYREINKLLSTYIDNIPNMIAEKTGRLHAEFNQNGAKTGRFSSRNPNLQNIDPRARGMFVAPSGYYIVNADFSAQEVRIIADLSQERVLLDAFERGIDAYASLASEFFDKPYEECYKNADGSDTEERKRMKVVLLMSMYGASKYGLSQALDISVDEAEKFLADFFGKYQNIKRFIDETNAFAQRHGFVWIGDKQRKRRLPEARMARKFIPYGKWNDPKYAEARSHNGRIMQSMRQGPNARVQGLAAIQTKITMVKLHAEAERRGWRVYFTIHDEVAVLIPESAGEEDLRALNDIMTKSYLLDNVENASDIEIQRRWGDSITAEEYLSGKEVPQL